MIDLHVHSTFSDGTLTPAALAIRAREIGLTALALTDHDNTAGLESFLPACAREGIEGIPGVEISADVKKGTLHILGYFVERGNPHLEDVLGAIRNGRKDRNVKILERLKDLGLALEWDEVARHAGEDVVGRPHFAQALLERGYVRTREEAFDRYLAKGKPAYIDRFRLSPTDSIAAIRGAGGVAVLAHPFTLEMSRKALEAFTKGLRDAGLEGVEVYYAEHTPKQTRDYGKLANDLGLVVTGGSDFHGEGNPGIHLGMGFGSLCVPEEALEALKERWKKRRQIG